MTAPKAKRAAQAPSKPPVTRAVQPSTPIASVPPAAQTVNGKKKKKKKGKGKSVAVAEFDDEEDEDEDGLPPLEPMNGTAHAQTRSAPRTGLSPELESVHLSTTASLSASVAAARRFNPTAMAEAELLATADHLARSMEVDPEGGVNDEYWASFPDHLRNFVRNTYSQLSSGGNEDEKTQAMYAIAQQIHSGVGVNLNATTTATTNTKGTTTTRYSSTATFPASMPFDSSIFSDPAFTLAMEQAAAANGLHPSPDRGNLPPTNVVLLNEYGSEDHDYPDGEYYSDDEGDEIIDSTTGHGRTASFTLNYKETMMHNTASPESPATRKKNKKKKRKGGTPQMPESPAAPAVGGKGTPTGPVTNLLPPPPPPPVSTTNTTRMPAPRPQTATNPPPSSRAAGKQPMAYPTPAPTNPPPSRRAASKAPITSHAYSHNHAHHHPSPPSSNASAPHKPRPPANGTTQNAPPKNNKIWSTSSTEERERIKEFWLGLSEEERRSLVKIEKEAVLRKMKEQQKHSCTCAVCGRKRNAIEEELEVLYDAYYEELEQYANHQQRYISSGGAIPPPQGPGPFPGSVELDKNGTVISPHHHATTNVPPRSKQGVVNGRKAAVKQQHQHPQHAESEFDEDDGDEEEYEEEEEYEDEEEEDEEEDEEEEGEGEDDEDLKPPQDTRNPSTRRRAAPNGKAVNRDGLVNFGNLTVAGAGNILTVADDLLKNDGQKFLEMMEQLAERRLQREDEAAAYVGEDSEDDEDEDEDVEDEDDEDDEDEDDEDEDEEVMTEEQRMEESKRMFSIFAARMFEQRVLQAYREKVAQERQLQLLRELEDEDKQSKEKEAKKQNANQKKKDKKRLQKAAKEEERAARAAEKAAEEAAFKEKQATLEEENRKKRQEDRQRREAQRKLQEEERQRKEEERRKRQVEEKEREAERERKRKEKEEKAKAERREREERERKSREEREAKAAAEKAAAAAARREQQEKEKEEREKKLAMEREEKEKADKEKADKEKEKAEKEARERERAQQQQQQQRASKMSRPPISPRNASSSSQRSQNPPAKKAMKHITIPMPSQPIMQPVRPPQQVRPSVVTGPQLPSSINPLLSPPAVPVFPPIIPPQAMSPRVSFSPSAPYPGNFVPGPPMVPGPSLGPSALPRNFGTAPSFDPPFTRGLVPPPPIAPPSKAIQNPMASPTQLVHGSRRSSAPDPGPITRPIPAPIARPAGDSTGSGSTSPSRRSPSPKGVLGSSALAADDDEVVAPNRRTVAPGPVGWGAASPRSAAPDMRVPWGAVAPPPPPGLSPRPPVWNNAAPGTDWHHPSTPFFSTSFVAHNPSPPPHTGS